MLGSHTVPGARPFDPIRRVIWVGVTTAAVGMAVLAVGYLIHVYALDRDTALLDLEEGGLVTWVSASATFGAGLVAALISFVDPAQAVSGAVLGVACAFLSFDDAVTLHEHIGFGITGAADISDSYVQLIWPALYLPLLAVVAILFERIARDTPPARRIILVGLALLVAAVGLEAAGVVLDRADVSPGSWLWTVEITLEEGIEYAGWVLIATGGAARLVTLALAGGAERAAWGRADAAGTHGPPVD